MTPFEKMESEFSKRHSEPFLYYVRIYGVRGFVFSRPDFFVMARPVPRNAPPSRILDDNDQFHGEKKDCWFVAGAAGNTARMFQVVPFELPWFCWARLDDCYPDLRFLTKERMQRLCPPDMTLLNSGLEPVTSNG